MVGQAVVVNALPPDLLPGLPEDCQAAITAIVGKPVKVSGHRWGLVELTFRDQAGDIHFVWIERAYLRPVRPQRVDQHVNYESSSYKVARQARATGTMVRWDDMTDDERDDFLH